MEDTFLLDGRKAKLVAKLDSGCGFLVKPYLCATRWGEDGDSEDYLIEGAEQIFVEQVFDSAPTEALDEHVAELNNLVKAKQEELVSLSQEVRKAKMEVAQLERRKTDLSKFIINRSEWLNAKRITFFDDNRSIDPIDSKDNPKGIKLSFQMSLIDGKMQIWGYKMSFDDWGSSNYIQNGEVLFDATDEEILEYTKARVLKLKKAKDIKDYHLEYASDKYLDEELMARKEQIIRAKKLAQKARLLSEIEAKKKELDNL